MWQDQLEVRGRRRVVNGVSRRGVSDLDVVPLEPSTTCRQKCRSYVLITGS